MTALPGRRRHVPRDRIRPVGEVWTLRATRLDSYEIHESPSLAQDLDALPVAELEAMHGAGAEVLECQRVLARSGDTVITELLRGEGECQEWHHYPRGDVYDCESHAQYYYHVHAVEERAEGEHGHFHTFLRPFGMPDGIKPAALPDQRRIEGGNDALSHLIGISVDPAGRPIRLFATNRWVTGETWYAAADVAAMLDRFVIDLARPSWPVNRWIGALMRLFRPQIVALLHARDHAIAERQRLMPALCVYEDRTLAIPAMADIDVAAQLRAIEGALRGRRRAARSAVRHPLTGGELMPTRLRAGEVEG